MDSDWNIECSDDELKDYAGEWEPAPEEIERLYNILEKGELPEITWKCAGYRSPSPELGDQPDQDTDDYKPTEDKSDFDFLDEASTPKLKIIRKEGGDSLKGSAKKKVTSLDGVINNMRRHKLLPSSTGSKTKDE